MKKKIKYFVGIDEAGRGPLAGPLALGVCVVPVKYSFALFPKLTDSKKCTQKKREEFLAIMKQEQAKSKIHFAVAFSSENLIDTKGVTIAVKTAMKQAIKKLKLDPTECEVFLDGGLKAPTEFALQHTIIKGDEKIPVISLASIAAKVTRDKKMIQLAKKYPQYGFEIHKGYGTLSHRKAILKHGPSLAHRKLFLRKLTKLSK